MYVDADNDGFGVTADNRRACPDTDGLAERDGDCDDARADVSPDAEEVCDGNGVDEDCDGLADDDDPEGAAGQASSWADADGDGFGDPATEAPTCALEEGRADNDLDCDDTDARQNPDLGCASEHDGAWSGTFETRFIVPFSGPVDCSENVSFTFDASAAPAVTLEGSATCPAGEGTVLTAVFEGPDALIFTLQTGWGTDTFRAELRDGDTFFGNEAVQIHPLGGEGTMDIFLELEPT